MSYFFAAGADVPALHGGATLYNRDLFRAHLSAVESLSSAGISPPPEWAALRDRYAAFIEMGNHAVDRLAAEVAKPSGADLTLLRNAAMAEELGTAEADASINSRVQAAVLGQLEALYSPVAQRNYRTAAERYNHSAKRFTDAAKTVDVEAAGETLVTATTAQREAWLSGPALAGDLEEALRPLLAAASLAGAPADVAYISGATDVGTTEYQLALALDPGKAHRRKTWVSWSKTDGRTGKWGALHALGVKLRASDDPRVTPYKRPEQPVAVARPSGQVQYWDPHDGPLPPRWQPVAVGWVGEKTSTAAIP